jgi:hypothetical protein
MTTMANGGNGWNLEVPERATRRRFAAEYGLGILEEANRCALAGNLEYADHVTVGICIENRREIE